MSMFDEFAKVDAKVTDARVYMFHHLESIVLRIETDRHASVLARIGPREALELARGLIANADYLQATNQAVAEPFTAAPVRQLINDLENGVQDGRDVGLTRTMRLVAGLRVLSDDLTDAFANLQREMDNARAELKNIQSLEERG